MISHQIKVIFFSCMFFSLSASQSPKLFVLSGPSGVGKSSIVNNLVGRNIVQFCPTSTTRLPRIGEKDGIDYNFVTLEDFELQKNNFIDIKNIYGNWYGIDQSIVQKKLQKSGVPVFMILTLSSAQGLKKIFPGQVTNIFIAPPSLQDPKICLTHRMLARGDNQESINNRLQKLEEEMSQVDQADYCIINDDLFEAILDIEALITHEVCNN